LDVIIGKYHVFNEQYTNWFMTLCNQDEDSEEQVDKTAEAPKGIGTEAKHRCFRRICEEVMFDAMKHDLLPIFCCNLSHELHFKACLLDDKVLRQRK
jgi:hypothetical protein